MFADISLAVDDPKLSKIAVFSQVSRLSSQLQKHILVDVKKRRQVEHMKKQVLYFCNSMCRQTSILIVSKEEQQQCENDHLPNSSNFDRQELLLWKATRCPLS